MLKIKCSVKAADEVTLVRSHGLDGHVCAARDQVDFKKTSCIRVISLLYFRSVPYSQNRCSKYIPLPPYPAR